MCDIEATVPVHSEDGSIDQLIWNIWTDWRDQFEGLKSRSHLSQLSEPQTQITESENRINFPAHTGNIVNEVGSAFDDNIGAFAVFELRDILEFTLENSDRKSQDDYCDVDTSQIPSVNVNSARR